MLNLRILFQLVLQSDQELYFWKGSIGHCVTSLSQDVFSRVNLPGPWGLSLGTWLVSWTWTWTQVFSEGRFPYQWLLLKRQPWKDIIDCIPSAALAEPHDPELKAPVVNLITVHESHPCSEGFSYVSLTELYYSPRIPLLLGESDLANNNLERSVRFEFYMNNGFIFDISMSHATSGTY